MSAKKKDFLSVAMERTSEWISSQEIPSDVTVNVAGVSFSLHKFPLVSKSGYIRKLISESPDADLTHLDLTHVPGGAEAFELAAKFCYCINLEIGTENIAMLRCVAEHLEMTEEYSVGNLVGRTEAYLNDVVFKSLPSSLSVLHSSENLQPAADEVKLVGRCIDTIAYMACKDKEFSSPAGSPELGQGSNLRAVVDLWAEDLRVLKIDVFQRVIVAMIARGFKPYALGPVLMLYAQQSLRGLELGKTRKKMEAKQEHQKRVVLESIVSLLPRDKNAMSVSFLSMLLRAAIHLETTIACRLDLEHRMGQQLGQAVLDDLMIPSFSIVGDTLFDVDTVQRIMTNFLEFEMGETCWGGFVNENDDFSTRPSNDMEKVVRLMESYVAEIASDRNLQMHKFIAIAELIPEQARINEDGMYRAIDIYLKAHPSLTDMERKKVCGVMDCQKLSREACAHAAQNERLPAQTIVQVLYHEQKRLREVMNSGGKSPSMVHFSRAKSTSIDRDSVPDELITLKKENQDMKFELVKMKMRLKEMEKPMDRYDGMSSPSGSSVASTTRDDKSSMPRKSFMGSVSKKLGKLYTLVHSDGIGSRKGRNKPARASRHSIS